MGSNAANSEIGIHTDLVLLLIFKKSILNMLFYSLLYFNVSLSEFGAAI